MVTRAVGAQSGAHSGRGFGFDWLVLGELSSNSRPSSNSAIASSDCCRGLRKSGGRPTDTCSDGDGAEYRLIGWFETCPLEKAATVPTDASCRDTNKRQAIAAAMIGSLFNVGYVG